MKITVTGSLGNISKPLATILVKAGHQVTVISSNADRTADIEALGVTAAIGSVDDVGFLTQTFTEADAVYAMIPNDIGAPDVRKHIASVGGRYAEAITAAGVKKVVLLSSVGAHLDGGAGPISGLHDVEQIFDQLDGVAVKKLRPVFFYINFLGNIDMIKHLGFIGSNYNENLLLALVHPTDIADVAAYELQQPFNGNSIRYIASDERTTGEIATTLGQAIGKPDLKWVAFSDEQALQGMIETGMPQPLAESYVEMGTAISNGSAQEDYLQNRPAELGKVKLEDFARQFAQAYNQ